MQIHTVQKSSKVFTLAIVIGLLAYWLSGLLPAHAQEASQRAITISPPSVFLSINPGQEKTGVLKVTNLGSEPLIFTVSAQDFIVQDTNGTPVFAASSLSQRFSAASWITITPNTFTLSPHQKKDLTFSIHVPKDARPGGHYAAVLYSPQSSSQINNSSGPQVKTEVGTLFSLDISGTIREQAIVTQFKTDFFHEYGPIFLKAQIKNYGDLHIKPIGSISIYNIFGKKVSSIPLEEHNIFPEAARDYTASLGSKWMVGRYTAQISATYGRANTLRLLATTSFIVFPWRIAVVISLILIALLLTLLYFKKKKNMPKEESQASNQTQPLSQEVQ